MKNKFFFLSTILSSCLLTTAGSQLVGDEMHPNMPNGKRPCYPSTKCTGDPNLIGPGRGGCSGGSCGYRGSSGYQGSQGDGNYGASTGKILQTESAEKITGTIKSMNRVSLPNQTQIQVVVSTDRGDMLVILGPAQFLDQQKIKFAPGDKVTITGYRIKANGNDVITAAQIQKNGNTLQLLNEKRQPLWGSHP